MAIEQEIFSRVNFIFGRTDWDRRISVALAPKAEYFHVDEVMRPVFYGLRWIPGERATPVYLTTSSPSIYKGFETIIDTARILVRQGVAFEWQVAGLSTDHALVRLICGDRKVANLDALHIRLLGMLSEDGLAERLMGADAYVQVSHIENSPNSVCEAMLAGVPVIASFAGGTGSLLRDGVEGVLVQDGDPYVLAGAMQESMRQRGKYATMAAEAQRVAQQRHDPAVIVTGMMDRYLEIIQKHSSIHE
jgi:glycosyltransferase involved in cell wall biosynthesis